MNFLRDIEHNEILVAVGEVAGIPLVEVVCELGLRVILRSNPAVLVADTAGVAVEHYAENATRLHSIPGTRFHMNLAGIGETVVSPGYS